MDDFLLLQSTQDSILPSSEEIVSSLSFLEQAIGDTAEVSLPSIWIELEVLNAELEMLKSMHLEKKSRANAKALEMEFRKEKADFNDSVTASIVWN